MTPIRDPLVPRRLDFPVMAVQPRPVPRPPAFGAVSGSDAHPAVVRRSADEILRGFGEQELRLHIGNRLLCVTGGPGPDPFFPFEHPVLLLSTSVRDYPAWPQDLDVDFLPVVAVAADRQWLDRMVLLRDGPRAREVAAASEAAYTLLWNADGMCVIDLATGAQVLQFCVSTRELGYRCCPLIPDAQPGDHCRMYSGGSVSQAIVAAGYWLDRRYVFLEELGCDEVCGEASVRTAPRLPTRYFTWLTERQIAQEWDGIVSTVRD